MGFYENLTPPLRVLNNNLKGDFLMNFKNTIKTINENLKANGINDVTAKSGWVSACDLQRVSDKLAGWSVHTSEYLTYPGCFLVQVDQQDDSVERKLSDWHDTLSNRTYTSARVVKTPFGQYVNPQKYKETILAQSKHVREGGTTHKTGINLNEDFITLQYIFFYKHYNFLNYMHVVYLYISEIFSP